MGQQQLLLIILGVIIVGIAVAVGITMFQDNAINANRDAISNDLVNLAARAQQYYRRPVGLGGGGNSFTPASPAVAITADAAGLKLLTNKEVNENGTYSIKSVNPTTLVLHAVGKYVVDNDSVSATCTVTATGYTLSTP